MDDPRTYYWNLLLVHPLERALTFLTTDLGLGAEVRWTFLPEDRRLALAASFDYFFPDDGDDEREYWEANLNLAWDFTTGRPVIPYAGVGINYAHARFSSFGFDTDQSDVGANVLTGVRINRRFYVEAKLEAGGGELFVLTVGLSF